MRTPIGLEAWVLTLGVLLPATGVAADPVEEDPMIAEQRTTAEATQALEGDGPSSFYGRGTLGLGYGAVNASDPTAIPRLDETFQGWTLAPSFAAGTRARENLFIHATAWFGGVTSSRSNARFYAPGMRMMGAGLGFTYYFMPSRVFVSATPGIAITLFRRPSGNYDAAALGFAAILSVGRDFLLRSGWALGCELEGRVTRTRADTETYLGGETVIALTISYGAPL